MSNKDNSQETSTFERETKKSLNIILDAITEMRQDFNQRLDGLETRVANIESEQAEMKREQAEMKEFMTVQFEAIRQGLVKNYNEFNRMESRIAENRSAIFSTKALVGELSERVYLMSKESERQF